MVAPAKAVRAAVDLRPDVVVMDYRLPDGTGSEATALIKAELPEVAKEDVKVTVDEDVITMTTRKAASKKPSRTWSTPCGRGATRARPMRRP